MPIQYPDMPQFQPPNFNFLGALAQGEAAASNDLRNQVMQNQLAEFQRKRALEEKLLGVTGAPGFNFNSPEAVRQVQAIDPDMAMKIAAAQDLSRYHAAATEHQRLAGLNQASDTAIRAAKYRTEYPGLQANAEHAITSSKTATLELHDKKIASVQGLMSTASEENYPELLADAKEIDPRFAAHLPPTYNRKALDRALMNAETTRSVISDELKARTPKTLAPTENMPGMVVSPRGVSKLPEVPIEQQGQTAWGAEPAAPVVRGPNAMAPNQPPPANAMQGRLLSPEAMELPPEAVNVAKTMRAEQAVQQAAPIGREKEALGKYRFSNTLQGIGNTFVDLAKAKGIAVPGEDPKDTLAALTNRSRFGAFFGKLNVNERLALVDSLRSQVSTAIPQFAAAAGLQSKNFDSNAEGERLRTALADPDNISNISSVFHILNDLNKQFGSGTTLFEPQKETQKIIEERRPPKAANRPPLAEFFK